MEEIRVNNKVEIKTTDNNTITGTVNTVEYDRVSIKINESDLNVSKSICELDDLKITAHTHFGEKSMLSCVINTTDENGILTVENNPTIQTVQKREFMRVACNFEFTFTINNEKFNAKSKNISAGGICFNHSDIHLELNQEITVILPQSVFEKELICTAKIIKINESDYIAQFENISENIESKIMKFVFKNVSKNSTGCEIG